jgi:hypothetical protein
MTFEIIETLGAMHTFPNFMFNNNHGLPITPETWIIRIFLLFMPLIPFISTDNWDILHNKLDDEWWTKFAC